jgi:hypothetical protein
LRLGKGEVLREEKTNQMGNTYFDATKQEFGALPVTPNFDSHGTE